MRLSLVGVLLIALCSVLLAEKATTVGLMIRTPRSVRCAMNEAEVARVSNWAWLSMSGMAEHLTAIVIQYNASDTPPEEISRCVDEISQSKPTQRHLSSFIDRIQRTNYAGRARQWEIRVADKVVCFLGVPR